MITIAVHPNCVFANDTPVDDKLAAAIVKRGKLVKVISDTKVVIRPDLNTPGIWRLPLSILKRLYIIPLVVMLMSCSSVYWENSRHTASGKHTYFEQGWGYRANCVTYSQQPIKSMTFKRYSYWRHSR